MRAFLVVLLLAATAARAENNCGRMERVATPIIGPPGIVEMQLVWLKCDGKFRRFEELVPAASRIEEVYDGWIEVGHVYRAKVVGHALERHPSLPRHHDGGYGWANADGLLPDDEQERTVVFVVASQEIEHVGERSWLNLLELVIRDVR